MIDLKKQIPGKASPSGALWLPLWMHSKDTAGIILRLLEEWLPRHFVELSGYRLEELKKICCLLALVHDLGKLTPVFAARITETIPDVRGKLEHLGLEVGSPAEYRDGKQTPHARAGEQLLLEMGCPDCLCAVVGAHHGKPQESMLQWKYELEAYSTNYNGKDNNGVWTALRKEWFADAMEESGFSDAGRIPKPRQPVQVLLSGLLIMADWIASNTEYFPLISVDSCGDPAMYPTRVEKAWAKLALPEAWSPQTYVMDGDWFVNRFSFYPNAVQNVMLRAANEGHGGIYILEAQMGVGKTEAALAAAEVLASKLSCGGIYFGLPTQATANGIFQRLVLWADKQAEDTQLAIRLAHGMAELNEDYRAFFRGAARVDEDGDNEERLIVHPWFNGRKQALLANFVIGTVDQLLLAALKQKHVMLRHLGLSGKVVVLDECHAYDAYMNQYLERALNWLGTYRIPVIMLSATLPEEQRKRLIEAYLNGRPDIEPEGWTTNRGYPLVTWTDGRAVKQETVGTKENGRRVRLKQTGEEQLIPLLRNAASVGGCCGVIVNTVRYAQELTKTIQDAIPEAEVMLLHSRFMAPDRADRERELLRRIGKYSTAESRRSLIVVGTQVMEQSLDIDLDMLVTQLCPMDLLLQRIGRLHRHERERPEQLREACCYILPADDGSRAVYGEWLLMRTGDLLPAEIMLPQSIPDLVQETYREPDEVLMKSKTYQDAWGSHTKGLRIKEQKATSFRISGPPPENTRRIRTIDGWLNTEFPVDGPSGEAAVRDGTSGITVLVMQEHEEGGVSFLPWQQSNAKLSPDRTPDEKTARAIAGQRLTLPFQLSSFGREKTTIRELEALNRSKLPEWQNSAWLHGELILLLDDRLHTTLCDHELIYSKNYGLICCRKEVSEDHEL